MKRTEFLRVSPESVGVSSRDLWKLLDFLEEADNCEPHGLMAMRHGKVFLEGWWAPYGRNIPHELFSMSKSYTATGLGAAYTEGLLDLNDPVEKYFPEYRELCPDPRARRILVRHVLTMSSGKDLERTDIAEWIPHWFAMKMAREPGSRFLYSAEDTHMCVALVEKVTGRRFEDYLGEKVLEPIGIDRYNLHWGHLLNGSVVGCGGLSATVEDSLRLMKLYLDGGVWEGKRILAEDYVRLATGCQIAPFRDEAMSSIRSVDPETGKPVDPEEAERLRRQYWEEGVEEGYGFQIWVNSGGIGGTFEANGGLGQTATVLREQDMIVSFQESSERNGRNEGLAAKALTSMLKHIAHPEPLPEDPESWGKLRKRLRYLSLGNPEAAPYSPKAAQVSGRRYLVKGNSSLTFRKPLWKHMVLCDPIVYMDGMKWFSFDFSAPDVCRLTFFEMDMVRTVEIGMDGLRRLNFYGNDRIPDVDKVLFDGAWVAEDTLRVNARWIQTCYSIGLDFHFAGQTVQVSAAYIHGDLSEHPLRVENYEAWMEE